MSNHSKTTRKCTKCFTAKLYNQFNVKEGKIDTWCMDCRDSYDTVRKKVASGSNHISAIKELKVDSNAVMSKSWLSDRIDYLMSQEVSSNCSLTRVTREFNQFVYSSLFC